MSKKYYFKSDDAVDFMIWATKMYPNVFKEWKAVKDIERSVEDDLEEVESDGV